MLQHGSRAQPTDISIGPDLLRLVEEVRRTHQPRVLAWKDKGVVVTLSPAAQKPARPRTRKSGRITRDDPSFQMVGIGDSGIPGGISEDKYAYFRRAFGVEEPS